MEKYQKIREMLGEIGEVNIGEHITISTNPNEERDIDVKIFGETVAWIDTTGSEHTMSHFEKQKQMSTDLVNKIDEVSKLTQENIVLKEKGDRLESEVDGLVKENEALKLHASAIASEADAKVKAIKDFIFAGNSVTITNEK